MGRRIATGLGVLGDETRIHQGFQKRYVVARDIFSALAISPAPAGERTLSSASTFSVRSAVRMGLTDSTIG